METLYTIWFQNILYNDKGKGMEKIKIAVVAGNSVRGKQWWMSGA
jgi:hypothetical protein